ncbi:hypothetical protein ACI2S3_10005 [Ralstonia nicotianae]|uniref:outer membrane protein W n=1 Tax=Ralstonia pseudosolanacearum TaxID=1310165 RepID=UPI0002E0A480|nr:outer membrane protein W [Ralstonia pseudosolanacearum]ESS51432.1 outer membrane protein w [Ralstonia solanacearum SD54]NJZ69851.1 OmpW family protein [Ralstonia solanacearum]MDO3521966.1 hypothetical protein [Ralstonia pseudosolanacearum]MDO3547326.1 hypothetical protein [Ralstonia pseudosolanacearum]MDO3553218.1 hypothetical protein [Ralstonia pseudosolanacearum]
MAVGWFHIRPIDSATPLATTTSSLGLGTWQSPGTDIRVSNANTLSLTFTHFFDDNWARRCNWAWGRSRPAPAR